MAVLLLADVNEGQLATDQVAKALTAVKSLIDSSSAYDAFPVRGKDNAWFWVHGNPDIVRVGPSPGSCIRNRGRYVTVGVKDFAECDFSNTAATATYLLPPVPARVIAPDERGKIAYLGVCSGCHIYNGRMVGPAVQVIQALYMDNPQGLADYIANPVKKRDDYPEMPPQNYLDPATRLAVAEYMLQVTN